MIDLQHHTCVQPAEVKVFRQARFDSSYYIMSYVPIHHMFQSRDSNTYNNGIIDKFFNKNITLLLRSIVATRDHHFDSLR